MKKGIIYLCMLATILLTTIKTLAIGPGDTLKIPVSSFPQIKNILAAGNDTFRYSKEKTAILLVVDSIPKKDRDNFLKFSGIKTKDGFKSLATTLDKIADTAARRKWLNNFNATGTYNYDILDFLTTLREGDRSTIYLATQTSDTAKQKIQLIMVAKSINAATNPPGKNPTGPSLAELVAKIKIDLKIQSPPAGNCCEDDLNPCNCNIGKGNDDINSLVTNKIIYLANKNLTVYYDGGGRANIIGKKSYTKELYKKYFFNTRKFETSIPKVSSKVLFKRHITVPSGSPLSLEIVNINPTAFKVEISDTATSFNLETDNLIDFLDLGNKLAANASQVGGTEEKAYIPNRIDSIRVALYRITEELNVFFRNASNACIYQHYALIQSKINAKKAIDIFMENNFGKASFESLNNFMRNNLDSTKLDTTLLTAVNKLYNELPAAFYPLASYIPEVSGNFDRVTFRFNILARENTPYISLVKAKEINTYPVGGFKVDISSGLYYSPELANEDYSIRADSNVVKSSTGADSTTRRGNKLYRENSEKKGEFGFASYLHFYPKISPDFNVSATIGAGVNFKEKPQIRYFLGASVLLGRENRLAITGGWIFGNVNQLSNQYDSISKHDYWLPGSETSVTYKKSFVSKPFIGISYNIPFIKKKKNTEQVVTPDTTPKPKNPGTGTTKTDSTKTAGSASTQSSNSGIGIVNAAALNNGNVQENRVLAQPAKKEKIKRKFH
ncbi:hypothetical protein [Ferruginibacter sp. SUN106]|uniref:hypothetical protein n=1 Tax=Ferruginibacter sp. SUN106 TaxID=2978348 RepID=UPI003D3647DB